MAAKALERHDLGLMLRWPASVLAALDALVIALARLSGLPGAGFFQGLIIASASLAMLLFSWMLLDPGVRYAINEANKEIKGGDSDAVYFRWRSISLLDPTWGLFGSRAGGMFIATVRVALMAEFVIEGFLSSGSGGTVHPAVGPFGVSFSGHGIPPSGLLLASLGIALTIFSSLIGLKIFYPKVAKALPA